MTSIKIWDGCDQILASAIKNFDDKLESISISSRNYTIYDLMRDYFDHVWQNFIFRYRELNHFVLENALFRCLLDKSGSTSVIDFDKKIIKSGTESITRNKFFVEKYHSLSHISKEYGFGTLDSFIKNVTRYSSAYDCSNIHDLSIVASLDSLREFSFACRTKTPLIEKTDNKCRFCGQLTELSYHLSKNTMQLKDSNDRSFNLSSFYCADHKPKEQTKNRHVRSKYLSVTRSRDKFDSELRRLDRYSSGRNFVLNTNLNGDLSDNEIADEFIKYYLTHNNLTDIELWLDDQNKLDTRLRTEARKLVDKRITDRKKKIVMYLLYGMNQAKIADKLGINKQAVSKNILSIPDEYRLDIIEKARKRRVSDETNKQINK